MESIEALKLGPTVLAGYSAGGVIAMAAAIAAPSRIAGLMLSNTGPSGKGHGDPDFPKKLLAGWGTKEFNDSFFSRCFSRPIPPLLQHRLEQYIGLVDRQAGYEISRSLREVDYTEALQAVTCPVMIAHGRLDKARTQAHVEMMTRSMPHAMLIGENAALAVSPAIPVTFLAIGLAGVELQEHIKFSFLWLWGISLVMLAFAVVTGLI